MIVDKGRPKFHKFPKGQKTETAMAHKNKTWKYPVDKTCHNVSYLLLRLKSRLEEDLISAGPK